MTGVEIDSRRVSPGDLFVAVSGGEAYVDDARARGAAATLVPDDDFAAMAAIGGAVRAKSRARVVAITGSVGKTSTKDILAALLRPHVRLVAAEAGFNNEIGLPLTLCRIEPDTEVVVTEMGMRGPGQIRALAEIARPDVGVVTAIAPVHLELLGSIEAIVRAKAELLEALPPRRRRGRSRRRARARAVRAAAASRSGGSTPSTWRCATASRTCASRGREVVFSFAARHQAANAATALDGVRGARRAAAGRGRRRDVLALAFAGERAARRRAPRERRLERESGRDGGCARVPARPRRRPPHGRDPRRDGGARRRRRAVPRRGRHRAVSTSSSASGSSRARYEPDEWVADAAAAAQLARELVRPGDVVLVKGSRSVGLEIVAEALSGVAAQ